MICIRTVFFAIVLLSTNTKATAQKQLQLDTSFLQKAQLYEPKTKSHPGAFSMSSFSFAQYKVIELKNHWESNSFWAVYLKEKNIRRQTVERRSGYSFQLIEEVGKIAEGSGKADTANVAVLFEKTTPEGFFITTRSTDEFRLTPEVTTVLIQSTKGKDKWQAVLFEASGKGLTSQRQVVVISDSATITSAPVDRWNNGKKPFITGIYGLGTTFHKNGNQIAAIQYPGIADPKIWISKELDEEEYFLMVTLLESLLIVATDLTEKSH